MGGENIEHHEYEALNSPFSKVYLCQETEQIINCAMGLKNPIDVDAIKTAFSNSVMLQHPRFCSLMVRDQNGDESWKKTHVDIDDHIVIHHHHHSSTTVGEDDGEAAVNAYLADLAVYTPLSKDKPLWELHMLMGLKCVVLRVHHALGDGVSIMSMLSSCFGEKNDDEANDNVKVSHAKKRVWREKSLWGLVKSLWFTLVFGLRLLGRVLWVKDKLSVISGGDGVELWPRNLVTVKFKLQDFKSSINKVIPNATINDVLLGIISSGFSKYLAIKSPKAVLQGLEVSGLVVVNLRKNLGLQDLSDLMATNSWGNKTGLFVQPVYCYSGLHALDHVRTMKESMDQKKQSYEAHILNKALNWVTSNFGPKMGSWCSHRVLCNTTFLISNIIGPSQEMVIGNNPVTYLRLNISSSPHAITMHLVSYAGNADLQVMVAKDIIDDPQFLANCFQDSLTQMKNFCFNNIPN